MSFENAQERGRPISIKDEGLTLNTNISSIDFVGSGVSGSNIGDNITETINGDITSSVSKTYAELTSMVSGSTLVPGQTYFISDKNIYVTATTTNQFATEGFYKYTQGRKAWGAIKVSGGFGGSASIDNIMVNGDSIMGSPVNYYTETETWDDRATHPYTIDVSIQKLIERVAYFINEFQTSYKAYANSNYLVIESTSVGTASNGFDITGEVSGITLDNAIQMSGGTNDLTTPKIYEIEYDFDNDNIIMMYDPILNNRVKQRQAFQATPVAATRYFNFTWNNGEARFQVQGDQTATITEGMTFWVLGDENEYTINGNPVYDEGEMITYFVTYETYEGSDGTLYTTYNTVYGNTVLDFNWDDTRFTNNYFEDTRNYRNFLSDNSFINDNKIESGVWGLNILQRTSSISFNTGKYAEIYSNDLIDGDKIQYNTMVGGVHRSGPEYMSKINNNYLLTENDIGSNQMLGGSWIMYSTMTNGSQIESLIMMSTGNIVKNSFSSTFFASMQMDDRASFTNNTFTGGTLFYSNTFKDDCFFSTNTLTGVFFADHTITSWDINNSTLTNVLWEQDFSNNLYWNGEVLLGTPSGAGSGLILSIENVMARSIQYGTRVKFAGGAGTGLVNDVIHLGQIRKGNAFETVFLYATALVGTGASIKIGITTDDDCILQSTAISALENGTRPVAIPLKFPAGDLESIILTVTGATITSGTLYAKMEGIFTQSADSVSSLATIPFTVGAGLGTTAANGMRFGSDTTANLYRSAAGVIKSDGAIYGVGGLIGITGQFNTIYPIADNDLTIQTRNGSTARNIIFKSIGSTPTETARFDTNGNFGIGATTLTGLFQVAQGTTGIGTVSTPGNSTTLTGVGTQFTNTFKVGDTLTVAGETVRTILTITSDTVLDVSVAFSATPRSAVAYTLTGGTRFVVAGNGRVGVNGATLTNAFNVNGDIKVMGAASYIYNNNFYPLASNANMKIETGTGYLSFVTNSTEKIRLLNTGELGIGTIAPTYKLDVRGTAAADGIRSAMGFDIYQVPDPTTLSGVVSAGGSVDTGDHWYGVTFTTAVGETHVKYTTAVITTTAGNNTVTLTIPVSTDPRVTGRKIYRTRAGVAQYGERLLATIANNIDVSYVDTTADSALPDPSGIVYFKPNTTSKNLTINGTQSLTIDTNGTFLGLGAGASLTTGGRNVFIGSSAGSAATTTQDTIAIGHSAGSGVLTGSGNIFIGAYNGRVATGTSNTGLGAYNLFSLTSGTNNVALGRGAGYSLTTASSNVFAGYFAGYYETGSNKIIFDNLDRTSEALGRSSALFYGVTHATPASQILALGGGGKVGINTIAPNATLHVYGTGEVVRIGDDTSTNAYMTFSNRGGFGLDAATGLRFQGTSTRPIVFAIHDTWGSGEVARFDTAGNLGLGTQTPDEKLQVVGTVKFGEDTTNFTKFESDGTMVMNGTATVWEDLRFPATAINPAGAASAMVFDTTNIGFTAGAAGTQVIAIIGQMPHSWKEGSDIYPHIHWEPTTTNTGNVLWRLEYKWTNIGDTEPAGFTTLDILDAGDGTALKHQIASFAAISGAGKTISSIITMKVSRIGGDATDTYTGDALLKEFDIHFESDTLGSRSEFTK
jgi:hypothetical protein